ncbi:asparagine synthase-related protein [Salipaludibacillus sp. CUR1]|uniref:asparagine synthase-related protein n=1 Tax=Salipaludibacillus sp. CUR1 TaxID=2820003 RepID=UPI001E410DC7|nr:asparagine synthase-related protein [Salipaludibacillus sp. CUR1]MCE7792762.1 asparagine synthase-related protein [Salipaludibacillus sp. CUR1]
MSAIAGIQHFYNGQVPEEHSGAMMKTLAQFPADDMKAWGKESTFLGCLSQWITPESVGEVLPFYCEDRKTAITADAIIDNREELFDAFQVDQKVRESIPDSRLILLAYEKWGEDSPKHLIGDFAFMIWDDRRKTLFGARDFTGTRTLYYYFGRQRFAFCTTIEPLLALPYISKSLNEEWLAEYLAITGMIDTAGAETTPYNTIFQVPPSHSITVKNTRVKLTRYCSLRPEKTLHFKSDEEYVEAFQEVFQKAVNSRLRTFRPVASQLSGGLDSGAVTSFAAKQMQAGNKQLHTFSYVPVDDFDDFTPRHLIPDERPFIKETVDHIGGIKDHYFDFKGKDSYSEIDEMLQTVEMPYKFHENSFWLKGMFEKAADHRLGVLLNGDRGNFSISWGSALDYYAVLLNRFKWIKLFQELNYYSLTVGGPRLRRIPLILRRGHPMIDLFFSKNNTWFLPPLINEEFAQRTGIYDKLAQHSINKTGWFKKSNMYEDRRKLFEHIFPWNAGNTFTCKMSLSSQTWKRDPSNDLRVVRFCLSVPEEQFVKDGVDRSLIRRATEHYLPDKVRLNHRFRGVQGADWVHRLKPWWQELTSELVQMCNDDRILKYVDGNLLKAALIKIREGPKDHCATDPDYKNIMRALIVYRFLQKF